MKLFELVLLVLCASDLVWSIGFGIGRPGFGGNVGGSGFGGIAGGNAGGGIPYDRRRVGRIGDNSLGGNKGPYSFSQTFPRIRYISQSSQRFQGPWAGEPPPSKWFQKPIPIEKPPPRPMFQGSMTGGHSPSKWFQRPMPGGPPSSKWFQRSIPYEILPYSHVSEGSKVGGPLASKRLQWLKSGERPPLSESFQGPKAGRPLPSKKYQWPISEERPSPSQVFQGPKKRGSLPSKRFHWLISEERPSPSQTFQGPKKGGPLTSKRFDWLIYGERKTPPSTHHPLPGMDKKLPLPSKKGHPITESDEIPPPSEGNKLSNSKELNIHALDDKTSPSTKSKTSRAMAKKYGERFPEKIEKPKTNSNNSQNNTDKVENKDDTEEEQDSMLSGTKESDQPSGKEFDEILKKNDESKSLITQLPTTTPALF